MPTDALSTAPCEEDGDEEQALSWFAASFTILFRIAGRGMAAEDSNQAGGCGLQECPLGRVYDGDPAWAYLQAGLLLSKRSGLRPNMLAGMHQGLSRFQLSP